MQDDEQSQTGDDARIEVADVRAPDGAGHPSDGAQSPLQSRLSPRRRIARVSLLASIFLLALVVVLASVVGAGRQPDRAQCGDRPRGSPHRGAYRDAGAWRRRVLSAAKSARHRGAARWTYAYRVAALRHASTAPPDAGTPPPGVAPALISLSAAGVRRLGPPRGQRYLSLRDAGAFGASSGATGVRFGVARPVDGQLEMALERELRPVKR
jgi:hypothetical protein